MKCLLLLVPVLLIAAEIYKLPGTKRIEQDLYRSGDLYIQTQYCYHYAYGEDALLSENKIIWPDDTTCDVVKIFRK